MPLIMSVKRTPVKYPKTTQETIPKIFYWWIIKIDPFLNSLASGSVALTIQVFQGHFCCIMRIFNSDFIKCPNSLVSVARKVLWIFMCLGLFFAPNQEWNSITFQKHQWNKAHKSFIQKTSKLIPSQ